MKCPICDKVPSTYTASIPPKFTCCKQEWTCDEGLVNLYLDKKLGLMAAENREEMVPPFSTYGGRTLEKLGAKDWARIELDGPEYLLCYHKQGISFSAICVRISAKAAKEDGGDSYYQVVFECSGTFDGVRHIFFGERGQNRCIGYINYPDLRAIAKGILELDRLQVEFCPYVKEDRDKEVMSKLTPAPKTNLPPAQSTRM